MQLTTVIVAFRFHPLFLLHGMINWKFTISICPLFWAASWANLPPKVMELKDSLMHEMQTLQHVIPGNHPVDHRTDHQVQDVMDEFLALNQNSIEAILRVLMLIDHDLTNAIHDCERVADLRSLDSTNMIFEWVAKPLLLRVRELCGLISSNAVEQVEESLEAVQLEASVYRRKLDDTLKGIAIVSVGLKSDVFEERSKQISGSILGQLKRVNETVTAELDGTFTKYFTKWAELYRKLTEMIPERVVMALDEYPTVAMVYDFFDFLDNETTVLHGEMHELMDYWVELVKEAAEGVTNSTVETDGFLREYPLELFLNRKARFDCVARYFHGFNERVLYSVDRYYGCVDFAAEMNKAFRRVDTVLDSVDKAIEFITETYINCATFAEKFEDNVPVEECLMEMHDLLNQTKIIIEDQSIDIYNYVIDGMSLNQVAIGACLYAQVVEVMLRNEGHLDGVESCSDIN
ncbi:uncharacterized protein LOC5575189 [Aedes aegypti]|uniref:Uncharacterized protein n=1 Tax=Aedes aegypti TaxID=7159 RepID=A0A6I8TVS7_AEDAE|nr:uncharacterized protein LOC5575189 [Aedes aegypti]